MNHPTSNPLGPSYVRPLGGDHQRALIQEPAKEVREKQATVEQTEGEFMRDLGKATRRKSS